MSYYFRFTSDWLLVWKQNDKELILILTETGTHSDIFGC